MDDGRTLEGIKVKVDIMESDIKELKETMKQHSGDIVSLKESDIEVKIYVKQIFEKIDEMKEMIQVKKEESKEDNNKDKDDRLDKFIDVMLETFKNNNKNENEIKFYKTKQFWIILASVVTTICSISVALFK